MNTKMSGRRGMVLLTATGMMFVLLAFVGLAFDVGYLQWSRRRAQTAADAAALAGAWGVRLGYTVVDEGRNSAALNGFTHGSNNVTVTINTPPTTGSYTADATAVEAIVSQDAPSFFMRALGWNILPVRARAVARQGYGTGCIYALGPNERPGLRFQGNVNVHLGCGAVVASTRDPATNLGGGATVTMDNGASIGSVGPYDISPNASVTPTGSLSSGVIFPGDPLAGLPMPTYTTQNCWNGSAMVSGPCTDNNSLPSGSYTPGVYCGGITVGSGVNAVFAPGTYILAGTPGLTLQGTVTGTGVTFYLTATSGWPCTGLNGSSANAGAVTVNSQANVNLSAPTTGTYAGIAIVSDRTQTNVPHSDINGGSNFILNGAIYMPNTDLSFSGSSDANGYLLIVTDTVDFTGTTDFNMLNLPEEFANNNPEFKKWIVLGE